MRRANESMAGGCWLCATRIGCDVTEVSRLLYRLTHLKLNTTLPRTAVTFPEGRVVRFGGWVGLLRWPKPGADRKNGEGYVEYSDRAAAHLRQRDRSAQLHQGRAGPRRHSAGGERAGE